LTHLQFVRGLAGTHTFFFVFVLGLWWPNLVCWVKYWCLVGASPCTSNTFSVFPKFTILPLFNIQVKVGKSGLGRSKWNLLRRQLSCTPKTYDYYFIFSRLFSLLHLKFSQFHSGLSFMSFKFSILYSFIVSGGNGLQNAFHNFMKRIL